MRKYKLHFVYAFVLIVGVQMVAAHASSWLSNSVSEQISAGSTGLVLKAAKKHCQRVFVCDYFAPATSCSTPPCCKKGHWEKNCEKTSKGNPSNNPSKASDSSPMNHPCYPSCQYRCAKTRGNLTLTQCIIDCLQTTRC